MANKMIPLKYLEEGEMSVCLLGNFNVSIATELKMLIQ